MRGQAAGGNLVIASILALLSYIPFESVAKGSFLVCVYLFIVDPFPPLSRLVSLISTSVIALLARAHRNHTIQLLLEEEEQAAVVEKKDN
jgi:hypothetical protein